jgi:hypothetical protein
MSCRATLRWAWTTCDAAANFSETRNNLRFIRLNGLFLIRWANLGPTRASEAARNKPESGYLCLVFEKAGRSSPAQIFYTEILEHEIQTVFALAVARFGADGTD